MAQPAGGAPSARDETGRLQHLETRGDAGLRYGERQRQFTDGGVSFSKAGEEAAPDRIGQRCKHRVQPFRGFVK